MNEREIRRALDIGIQCGGNFVWIEDDTIWAAPVCGDYSIDWGNQSEACFTGVPEADIKIVCTANLIATCLGLAPTFTADSLIDRP